MSLVSDPEQFLAEKLQKRSLSINTVRDGILASIIVAFQRAEEALRGEKLHEPWRQQFAAVLRGEMVKICEDAKIPTEYPTLDELKNLAARLERQLQMERLDPSIQAGYRQATDQLFAKAQE